jgi:CheY-like chemotaxis protein
MTPAVAPQHDTGFASRPAALDTEEVMQRLGVATVRIASGVADALKTIDEQKPDFALLDVNLGVETSFEIAERLQALKVPFAFATVYGEQIAFPKEFAAVPKIRKPYSTETLRATLQNANPS